MEPISDRIQCTVTGEGYKAFAEIVKAESHGGKVLLYAEEGRRGDDAQAALALLGIPLVRRNLTPSVLCDYALLLERALPENLMAIAGVGGAAQIEAAKAVRAGRSLPRILFPLDLSALSAADDRIFFGTKGDLLSLRSEGQHTILAPEILSLSGETRAGLGYLLARLVEKADEAFEGVILEGKIPAPTLREIKQAATLFSNLREENAAADLTEIAIDWQKRGVLDASHEAGAPFVLAMLAAKQTGGAYPDYLFPASYALLRLYESYLADFPLEHCPPPDREQNVLLLAKRCGMSTRALRLRGKPYAEGYEERSRRAAEYREDFAELFSKQNLPLAALTRVYRRAKKGQAESRSLDAGELLSLLSLTGEAVSGYPLLKHIKMTGLIEPLIAAS